MDEKNKVVHLFPEAKEQEAVEEQNRAHYTKAIKDFLASTPDESVEFIAAVVKLSSGQKVYFTGAVSDSDELVGSVERLKHLILTATTDDESMEYEEL